GRQRIPFARALTSTFRRSDFHFMDPAPVPCFLLPLPRERWPVSRSERQRLGPRVIIFRNRRTSRFRRNNEAPAQNPRARPIRRVKDAGLAGRDNVLGGGEFDGALGGTDPKESLNRSPGGTDLHRELLSLAVIIERARPDPVD